MFNIFKKPTDRLKSAIEDARLRKPNSATALRTTINKDGREVAEAGETNLVCEAYHELVMILAETGQTGTAITTLSELAHLPYASEQVLTTSLALLGLPVLGESEILHLGNWLKEDGRLKYAVSVLRSVIDERFRRSATLAILLGDALVDAGEMIEAGQRYKLAFDFNHDDGSALLPRFENLVSLLPKDSLTQQTLGFLYFTQRNYSQAIQHLEIALTLGDVESSLLFTLSDAYIETRNFARAVDILERLLKQRANAAELIRRCDLLLERYTGQDWISRRTLRLLGDVLRSQQRSDEALSQYRQSLENLEVLEANEPFAESLLDRLLDIEPHVSQNSQAEMHLVIALAYLIIKKPAESTDRCLLAVKSDPSVGLAAVDGLSRIVDEFPDCLQARLELGRLQLALEDYQAALISLNQFRADFPQKRSASLDIYQQLLDRLDEVPVGKEKLSDVYVKTLSGTLEALAEETAEIDPTASLIYLERMLDLEEPTNPVRIKALVEKLGLVQVLPVGANLLLADVHLALQEYFEALEACKAVPIEKQHLDDLIARLENIASREAFPVHALIYAAHCHLTLKKIKPALTYLQRAFDVDATVSAPVIMDWCNTQRKKGDLPAEGLILLSEAILFKLEPSQADWLLEILRDLLKYPGTGLQVVEKVERFLPTVDAKSELAYLFSLVQADGWQENGGLEAASKVLLLALDHPFLNPDDVQNRLEKITGIENAPAMAWQALGNTLIKAKKPDLGRIHKAFRQALEIDSSGMAGTILERIAGITCKKGSVEALAFQALQARCLIGLGKTGEAMNIAREILEIYPSAGVLEVLSIADLLPDGAETWYLRAEAEMGRECVETAAQWMEVVGYKGPEALVRKGEALLQHWIKQFPKQPVLRLSHAIALNRLGESELASSELSAVATDFPEARGRAMELLNSILENAQNASTWMEMARGLLAQDNIPQTLEYLRKAWAEPGFANKAYGLLTELFKRHPKDASVLKAMVELETQLGLEASLVSTVEHAYEWLSISPHEASDVAALLESTVNQSNQVFSSGHPVALKIYLVWVDALFAAGLPDQAAQALGSFLEIWPREFFQVIQRSLDWLATRETKSIRLVTSQAYNVGEDFQNAIKTLEERLSADPQDIQDFIHQAEIIFDVCKEKAPTFAGQACRLITNWQLQIRSLEAGKDAAFRACQFNPELLPEILDRLAKASWDETSQRELGFTRAEICCQAGEKYYPSGLSIYSELITQNFELNFRDILKGLKCFPKDYWPAHQLELEIFSRLTPELYPLAFSEMKSILAEFGQQHAEEMLTALDAMDQAIPDTHLMRVQILETCENLEGAASALLELQQTLPDQLKLIEQAMEGLIKRYPVVFHLQIAFGDIERNAQKWNEAIRIYRGVQQHSPIHIPQLLQRYIDMIVHQPDDCQARWALAQSYQTLEDPDQAALYLDQITELDLNATDQAANLAGELTGQWPQSGAAWFIRGKLAYKQNLWKEALELLERAREEGLGEIYLVRLHDMLARAYHATENLQNALANIRSAAALAPDDPAIRQEMVLIRLALIDSEIDQLKKQSSEHPENHQVALSLADHLIKRGLYQEALPLLQSLVGTDAPQTQVYLQMADCFSADGLHHLAVGSLQSALSISSLSGEERKELLYRQATALRRLMRFEESIHSLEMILVDDLDYLNTRELLVEIQKERVTTRVSPSVLKLGSRFLPDSE